MSYWSSKVKVGVSLLSHFHTIILVGVAALAALLLEMLSVPVAWLLGPMLVGVVTAVRYRRPVKVPEHFYLVGTMILGVASGIGFPPSTLLLLGQYALPLTALVLLMVGLSMLNGYLLARWTGLDIATALMGSLPGMASTMVIMSAEVGAKALVVAMLQYLRLLMLILIIPPVATALFPMEAISDIAPSLAVIPIAAPYLNLALLALAGVIGALLGRLIRLPASQFLGPMLVMLALSWALPVRVEMPQAAFAGAMLLLGLVIGGRFDVAEAHMMGRVAVVKAGLVLGLISISFGLGYLFSLITGVSAVTAVLGAVPGAMEVIVSIASELGADSGLVLAMQITRMMVILFAGPWIAIRLLTRLRPKQDSV